MADYSLVPHIPSDIKSMMGGIMQDYLNLVFLDGQWWIMAKMWEKVGEVGYLSANEGK